MSRDVRFPGDKPPAVTDNDEERSAEDDGTSPTHQIEGEKSTPEGTSNSDLPTQATPGPPTKKTRTRKDWGPPTRASTRLASKQNSDLPKEKGDTVPTPAEEHLEDVEQEEAIVNNININVAFGQEPVNYQDAISGPDAEKWTQSMKEEWDTLNGLETFRLVKLPPGRTAIGCKWVYRIKKDEAGNPVSYKSRLVAQGFSQKYQVDYNKTFSTVARTTSFKTLADIATREDMELYQPERAQRQSCLLERQTRGGDLHEAAPWFRC